MLLRNLIALQDQGAEQFFGEPEFDTADLLRVAADGRGVVSLLELPRLADRPRLFSTFLMWLLADLFEDLPEVGDVDKPKLVFFFDEAHLLFDDASKAFLEAIAQTVRLIRSKGVGIFFVTQTPKDVPRRSVAARQPGAARAACLHPGRRQGAQGDRLDVPELRLRPGRAAHPARYRRSRHHRAVRTRGPDPGGVDPAAGAAVQDGTGRRGGAERTGHRVADARQYAEQVDRDSAYELAARLRKVPARKGLEGVLTPRTPPRRAPRDPKPDRSTAEKVLGSPAFRQMTRSAAAVVGRGDRAQRLRHRSAPPLTGQRAYEPRSRNERRINWRSLRMRTLSIGRCRPLVRCSCTPPRRTAAEIRAAHSRSSESWSLLGELGEGPRSRNAKLSRSSR